MGFEHLGFEHWDLFRISGFGFRISAAAGRLPDQMRLERGGRRNSTVDSPGAFRIIGGAEMI